MSQNDTLFVLRFAVLPRPVVFLLDHHVVNNPNLFSILWIIMVTARLSGALFPTIFTQVQTLHFKPRGFDWKIVGAQARPRH